MTAAGQEAPQPRRRGPLRSWRLWVSLLLTLSLVGAVWHFVDPRALLGVLARLSWPWLAAALSVFLFQLWLRALRLRLLTRAPFRMGRLWLTLCVQSTIAATLPAGLGEAGLVYLLRRLHAVTWHLGAAAVTVARLAEVAIFAVVLLLLFLLARDAVPAGLAAFLALVILALVAAAAALAGLAFLRSRSPGFGSTQAPSLLRHLDGVVEALGRIHGAKIYAALLFQTALIWLCTYLFTLFIIRALAFDLTLAQVLWIYAVPTDLLPIKGVANLGTHEAAWFAILLFLGQDAESAAVLAFASHVLIFGCRILTSLPAALILFLAPRGGSGVSS